MSIRLPLKTVLDVNNSAVNPTGPASVSGGVAHEFNLPQDTDNVVVKLEASILAGGVSATLQTSDDGGISWYECARTSIVSNTDAINSVAGGGHPQAEWLSVPVVGTGARTGYVNFVTSVIIIDSVTGITTQSSSVKVIVNNQSATA